MLPNTEEVPLSRRELMPAPRTYTNQMKVEGKFVYGKTAIIRLGNCQLGKDF
jgi:hypothetical protein